MKVIKAGYVYVIDSGHKVKIGMSKNIDSRLNALQSQGGFVIKERYITPLNGNYDQCEKMAHSLLSEYRDIGEWFNIPFNDAVEIVKKCHKDTFCDPIVTDTSHNTKYLIKIFEDLSAKTEILNLVDIFGWTEKGKDFVLSLPFHLTKVAVDLACECPAISIVDGDRIHIIYPYGYEEHDKSQYILRYDKNSIAKDLECPIEDVPNWDDFCLDITKD